MLQGVIMDISGVIPMDILWCKEEKWSGELGLTKSMECSAFEGCLKK